MVLLEDLLGIRDAAVASPNVSAEARRRRLAGLIGPPICRLTSQPFTSSKMSTGSTASEAMLAELLTNVSLTQAMVGDHVPPRVRRTVVTSSGDQGIKLEPLDDSATWEMTAELIGPHPSMHELAANIIEP